METVAIVFVVAAVAWFALSRVAVRRRALDQTQDGGWRTLSWLPAWMILGGMGAYVPRGDDGGAAQHSDASDWGGGPGGDAGGGFGGDGGGFGGDAGGGFSGG